MILWVYDSNWFKHLLQEKFGSRGLTYMLVTVGSAQHASNSCCWTRFRFQLVSSSYLFALPCFPQQHHHLGVLRQGEVKSCAGPKAPLSSLGSYYCLHKAAKTLTLVTVKKEINQKCSLITTGSRHFSSTRLELEYQNSCTEQKYKTYLTLQEKQN